jgi:AcrR family transcriptional regulator
VAIATNPKRCWRNEFMTGTAGSASASARVRPANPRGQDDRLRQQLLAAARAAIEAHGARQLTLRGLARKVGVTPPSLYLHFPNLDHLLAAIVEQAFGDPSVATNAAARDVLEPADELRARCRAYCRFGLAHPHLYQLMFQEDLPLVFSNDPESTPGRRSFDNLVSAVRGCLEAAVFNDSTCSMPMLRQSRAFSAESRGSATPKGMTCGSVNSKSLPASVSVQPPAA